MFLLIAFIYGILMALFLVLAVLLLRQTVQESLSPRLKTVMAIFSALALAVFIFSLYALVQIYQGGPSAPSAPNYEREINF